MHVIWWGGWPWKWRFRYVKESKWGKFGELVLGPGGRARMSIGDDFADRDGRGMAEQEARWPLDPPQDAFEEIVRPMEQAQHDQRLTEMNVTLQTWRVGHLRIDLRPRWTWGRLSRGQFSLGRISVGWHS
jgi:hypothetical protein